MYGAPMFERVKHIKIYRYIFGTDSQVVHGGGGDGEDGDGDAPLDPPMAPKKGT